jgi:hypothetical protein
MQCDGNQGVDLVNQGVAALIEHLLTHTTGAMRAGSCPVLEL